LLTIYDFLKLIKKFSFWTSPVVNTQSILIYLNSSVNPGSFSHFTDGEYEAHRD